MALRITQLSTTDGHLRDAQVDLAPGLNCIIGARGTCKSTIVETIRFLFDNDRDRIAELLDASESENGPGHRGLIAATLRGGTAQLRLHLESPDAEEAVIERDISSDRPSVYRDGVIVVDDPELLNEIEIYSQGELQDIATDPAKRLALVDRPHQSEIDGWRAQIGEISAQVATIGPQLREIAEAVEAAEASLAEGQPLTEQLAQLQAERPKMSTQVSELRAAHQEREVRLQQATAALERYGGEAEESRRLAEELSNTAKGVAVLGDSDSAELKEIAERLHTAASAAGQFSSSLADPLQLEELLEKAAASAAAESEPYYEALREEEAVTDKLKQEDRLAEEVKKLDRIKEGLDRNRSRRDALRAEREQLRAKIRELRAKIFELRLGEVERINANFSEKIVLALRQGTHTDRYGKKLASLLEGSRLRDRHRLCADLAAAFPPDALVDAVEAEDSTTLAKTLDRDPGQMVRLVAHLSSNEHIFGLESEVPDDELDVTMYVEGKAQSVSEMSKGQKATAILPLLLRPAPYPMILDQPEDDLDNRFIFETLVAKIKELKAERQLIFVTHNANIPVIGDADRVLTMGMNSPEQAELAAGNVEEMREPIIELLEGGRSAFELRGKTYGLPDG